MAHISTHEALHPETHTYLQQLQNGFLFASAAQLAGGSKESWTRIRAHI